MTIYRVTFSHGQTYEFEGDRLEDNGLSCEIWNGDELVIKFHDNSIVSITSNANAPIDFADIYGHKDGVRLYDDEGRIIEAYRTIEAMQSESKS